MKRLTSTLLALLLTLSLIGCYEEPEHLHLDGIPAYTGDPYVELEDNIPQFTQEDQKTIPSEQYSPLDHLGRCGQAVAKVGLDTMPTEERGNIGQVKPSGWQMAKYDNVDGKYLYNRCHLIGYQLTGENANKENLITGTRYLNVTGMLPFENEVADYVHETGNHVLYRVTPLFEGNELVARGVQMEAQSVEDQGKGVSFHVYVYNVQPGITIDYATGESWLDGNKPADNNQQPQQPTEITYILNKNSIRFHLPSCSSVESMKPQNRIKSNESRQELINRGYEPCGQCKP